MPEFNCYKVTLCDDRINWNLEYSISGVRSGDLAIARAKAQACADAGLPYSNSSPFSVVSVVEVMPEYQVVV